MDLEFVPKVFILRYQYSEEDYGTLCVFNNFKSANDLKLRLEESALKENVYIRFFIDVYEVLHSFNDKQVSIFEHLSLKV